MPHHTDALAHTRERFFAFKKTMKEFMDEIDIIRQRLATKSVGRETMIALLEEENELKDARIKMLEQMVGTAPLPNFTSGSPKRQPAAATVRSQAMASSIAPPRQ